MALTRRTAAFGEIARTTEELLEAAGIELPAQVVDEAIRERIHDVAEQMRITDRTALGYTPKDFAAILAAQIQNQLHGPSMAEPRKKAARAHLRVVKDQ